MAQKKKTTRRKLQLPDVPPAPERPLPQPFNMEPAGQLRGLNKSAYHHDEPPYPFASKYRVGPDYSKLHRRGVDPDFLSRFTTGPISNEQDVLRQFEEYEALTEDPLMELKRRHAAELKQAEQDHSERLRQPYPLTSDTRRRRK
jgi:hypothetical protein|tara:strand:- start:37 stop:468 length:432 start_codon:yes stop_codon:yes gene_type:complete